MSVTNVLTSTPSASTVVYGTPAVATLRSPHLACDDFLPNDLAAAMQHEFATRFTDATTDLEAFNTEPFV